MGFAEKMKKMRENKPEGWVLGLVELAGVVSRSERIINSWKRQGMPIAEETEGALPNWYDVDEVKAWARENGKIKPDERNGINKKKEDEYLSRCREQRYIRERRLNLVEEGQVIDAQDGINETINVVGSVWSQILSFKERMPMLLQKKSAKQIKKIIDDNFKRAGEGIIKHLDKLKNDKK